MSFFKNAFIYKMCVSVILLSNIQMCELFNDTSIFPIRVIGTTFLLVSFDTVQHSSIYFPGFLSRAISLISHSAAYQIKHDSCK